MSSPSSTPDTTQGEIEVAPDLDADLGDSLRKILQQEHPSIPPRFLYDELGSHLFALITEIDDYYPTRTEAALIDDNLPAILAAHPVAGCTMIDIGAGNCAKAVKLFDAVKPACYVPVDVSADFLENVIVQLRQRFPNIRMTGVGADFSAGLELPPSVPEDNRLLFFPGSSIGNFSREQAEEFLRSLHDAMGPDGALWITADLDKDPAVLERAYDDDLGITAAFNKNVLNHVNRVAGTDFVLADWRHVAPYDRGEMRIQMFLEAVRDVTVRWPGGERVFKKGDRIHTENSHKNTVEGFTGLLARAGMRVEKHWTDERGWMGFFVAVPA